MIADALARVVRGESLSREAMRAAVRALVERGDERLGAALLATLRMRGETLEELVGAATAVRELALPLPEAPPGCVDTCGTGGAGDGTFNVSTAAALVVAASGVPVAKHGNRRVTSSYPGSAEVLEVLGIPSDLPPSRGAAAVKDVGIGFLFARACHPAMAAVGPLRASLPFPTLFNRIAPLCNPMRVKRHLMGVGSAAYVEMGAHALAALGAERAWVVHGEDGVDEISTCAATRVCAYEDGRFRSFVIEPGKWVPTARLEDLRGGDAEANAAIIRGVLAGDPGPARDVVLLNAAAALVIAGHLEATDLAGGLRVAARAIESGAARARLEAWVRFCAQARDAERREGEASAARSDAERREGEASAARSDAERREGEKGP
jgi:anthranilate phosphoribosyltransferase